MSVEDIKKALEGVTPVTWNYQFTEENGEVFIIANELGGLIGAALPWPAEVEEKDYRRVVAYARYIAAVNPKTISDLISTLEALQRENEEQKAWIKTATLEITKAIGGGSEMFTQHGDDYRVDHAFVATYIQFRRDRHADSKKASIKKERELLARAETAEAEVKRLREKLDPFSWFAGVLFERNFNRTDSVAEIKDVDDMPHRIFAGPFFDARTALASAGEEHHAE